MSRTAWKLAGRALALVVLSCIALAPVAAQAFPRRPVTAIVPWAPGGGTDTVMRALAREAERHLGQPITVTNNTGGGGAVGHSAIMHAAPDGHTIGIVTFELNSLPPQGLIPFDHRAFDPIMRLNADPAALTVHRDSPFTTLKDFLDFARANPGRVTIGNSGPGSVWHIAAGLMAQRAGINVVYVPFDGAAPAITALVGNHIRAVSVSAAEVRGQVLAGQLRILGIMDTQRSPFFPDVPTFREQGLDVVIHTWRGLALPRGVPAPARQTLSDAFKRAFDSPEFRGFMERSGFTVAYQDATEFGQFLAQNATDVAAVMRNLGLAR